MSNQIKAVITAQNKTQRAFAQVNKNVSNLQKSFRSLKAIAVTALSAGFAKSIIDSGDELQKLAFRLGGTVEGLSELKYIADLSNISFETMAMATQRMTRRLGEVAATGKGVAAEAFEVLGLQAEKLAQLPLEEQFMKVASALAEVENASQRAYLAQKIFDSEGVKLIQTLDKGAEGLRQMRDEAHQLGAVVSTDTANSFAELNDSLSRLKEVTIGVFRDLLSALAPILQKISDLLTDSLGKIRKYIRDFTDYWSKSFKKISNIFKSGTEDVAVFNEEVKKVAETNTKVALSLEQVKTNTDNYRESLKTVNKQTTQTVKIMETASQTIENSLVDAFRNADQDMRALFRNTINAILSEVYRLVVIKPLLNAIMGGISAGFGAKFSGTSQAIPMPIPKPRANGGLVSAGSPYMVGESGKELFVPKQNGEIIPNSELRNNSTNINLTINAIDTQSGLDVLLSPEGVRAIKGVFQEAKYEQGLV